VGAYANTHTHTHTHDLISGRNPVGLDLDVKCGRRLGARIIGREDLQVVYEQRKAREAELEPREKLI
jgi:hypothetical protein